MPFEIRKDIKSNKWKVYNLEKKRYAKTSFNSKQTAKNQVKNWERYSKLTTGKK